MRKMMFEDDDDLDIADVSYHLADSSADMSMTQI